MATVAMATKILYQSPIMATLTLKGHMDSCRKMERGTLWYLLPWKPKCCHSNQNMCSMWPVACFSLPSLALDLSMNCWRRVRYLLPWLPTRCYGDQKCLLGLDGQLKRQTQNMQYRHYVCHGTVIPLYWLEPLERGKALVSNILLVFRQIGCTKVIMHSSLRKPK